MYSFMSDRGSSQQSLVRQVHGPHLRNTGMISRSVLYLMVAQRDTTKMGLSYSLHVFKGIFCMSFIVKLHIWMLKPMSNFLKTLRIFTLPQCLCLYEAMYFPVFICMAVR